jgi:dTDP-4-dehydrorhamnose reductase
MRIVLFGKNGQLGWEFQRILPILGEVIALGRDEVDVSDLHSVQKILNELKPNLIINASAYTEVDRAEIELELAMNINALAPAVMAEAARKQDAVFIQYSTDYVFDGKKDIPYTENDPTHPLNTYGRSKLMGEENIKQAGDAYLILRTSWVYSLRGNSFVNKVLGWARKNENLKIVSDQISGPTWARMLAGITSLMLAQNNANLLEIIRERRSVYHLAGAGYTSRYEWAKEILVNDPNRTEQIVRDLEPARSDDFPTTAVRPLFSALDCTRFEDTFGLKLPNWNSTLKLAMTR